MEAPHFVAAASLLSASDTDAAELVPVSFFVAWNGVLALVYEGFPPGLVDIKAKLTNALPVSPEKFGSLWPKTTLAALHDESPLSLAELETLRGLCEEHAAALPPIALDSVSIVEYVQRGLELVRREHRQPLRPLAAGAAAVRAAATEVERVQGVLSEWSDLREYLPRVNAPGSLAASRTATRARKGVAPFGCTVHVVHDAHVHVCACTCTRRAQESCVSVRIISIPDHAHAMDDQLPRAASSHALRTTRTAHCALRTVQCHYALCTATATADRPRPLMPPSPLCLANDNV